jgi:5,10-methenyltetrahydrofolate synthetase
MLKKEVRKKYKCYPRTDIFQNTMQAVLTDDETEFDANEYGIPEPVNGTGLDAQCLDAVLVPMLGFDKRGYRVGYGKGFYDRYLQHIAGRLFEGLGFAILRLYRPDRRCQ